MEGLYFLISSSLLLLSQKCKPIMAFTLTRVQSFFDALMSNQTTSDRKLRRTFLHIPSLLLSLACLRFKVTPCLCGLEVVVVQIKDIKTPTATGSQSK